MKHSPLKCPHSCPPVPLLFLAWLLLAILGGCSNQRTPHIATTGSANPQSAQDTEPNPCALRVCDQGTCYEVIPQEVIRCDLPQELLERQLATQADGRAAGVCHQGTCIPRTMCSELCAGDLAEALALEVGSVLDTCGQQYQTHTDEYLACEDQVLGSRSPLRQRASRELAGCMIRCGFKSIDLSQADFL